jgi:hypothetical protein
MSGLQTVLSFTASQNLCRKGEGEKKSGAVQAQDVWWLTKVETLRGALSLGL